MVSSGTKGCDLSSGSVGSGLEVRRVQHASGGTKGCHLKSGPVGSGLEVLSSTKGCKQNWGMGSFAGSLTHQQTYLKSVAALGKFAIPPGEVSELSGPVATEKYFDPSKMILAECQRVNLATLTGVERARYWHRTLGGVNMKRLQAMSAQGKVDGLHQISNPHEDFAATTEGKWRRDPIVRSKINNKLQMKEAPYSRLFCDGKYGFSTKSVGGRVLTFLFAELRRILSWSCTGPKMNFQSCSRRY